MSEGRWTQDDVATLVAMLRDGRTTEEAANALGRTVPAIWQYMRYHRQAFQGLPEKAGRGTQSGDDGKRSVYAPLPRLRSTYHGLPLPQVLEAAQVQRRLRCRPYLSGHRDIPCLNLRKIWPVVKF